MSQINTTQPNAETQGQTPGTRNITIHTALAVSHTDTGNAMAAGGHKSIADQHFAAARDHNRAIEAYKAAQNDPLMEVMANDASNKAHKSSEKAHKASLEHH